MADNYLEKKMDEYRRGAAVKTVRRHLSPSGERPGTVSLKIEPLRVLVTDVADDCAAAVVRRLRDAGCRVAFVAGDDKLGRALSQSTGSRYYPASLGDGVIADIAASWGGLDVIVIIGDTLPQYVDLSALKRVITIGRRPSPAEVDRHDGMTVNAISTDRRTPSDVAHICLLLCLTGSECIDGLVL